MSQQAAIRISPAKVAVRSDALSHAWHLLPIVMIKIQGETASRLDRIIDRRTYYDVKVFARSCTDREVLQCNVVLIHRADDGLQATNRRTGWISVHFDRDPTG